MKEKQEEIDKYKELVKYVEQRYTSMLEAEEEERDEEVQGVLLKSEKDLQD